VDQSERLRVTFAEIDEEGKVTKRFPRIDAEGQLKNTVRHKCYPDIRVAVVSVPTLQLDAYEEAKVREALMRQRIDGVEYRLVGASGSAKDLKFYAQAKGSFKIMQDDVADILDADIILPESSVKPQLEMALLADCQKLFSGLSSGIQGTRFRLPIVLGIRDVRYLQFKSSYTLIEHASRDSLHTEIIPRALEEVRSVVSSALSGDCRKLLEAIGTSAVQRQIDDAEDDEYTSYEASVVEAVLKADASGSLVRHPYLNTRLQQLFVKWAFKVSAGGAFRPPAYALPDDGYLFAHDGQIFAGSDCITVYGIGSVSTRRGLVVRYPIRMKEDLLRVELLSVEATVQTPERALRSTGCRMDLAQIADRVDRQLRLQGTFVLHSKAAERNSGGFDFDLMAVLPDSEFPRFVHSFFKMREEHRRHKDKQKKVKSPWWNLADVAMKARGNQIGRITNLISNSIAAGLLERAYELVGQLQNALESLKHHVTVDQAVIKWIRSEVPKTSWRDAKEARRISQMQMDVPVYATDIVGQLYNHVRKELGVLFEETLPLREFGGMIRGETFTRKMHEDCVKVNCAFGVKATELRKRSEQFDGALKEAHAEFERLRNDEDQQTRHEASKNLYRAKAALRANQKRCREEMGLFHRWLLEWGDSKPGSRRGWCQALHSIAVSTRNDKATAAIVFHAFPQEVIDKIVEETGGQPIQLNFSEMPDGEITFDESGNVFPIERGASRIDRSRGARYSCSCYGARKHCSCS
jgi:hypothetical protein